MTTREPGASEVFTHGLTVRPRSTAFLASRPAAIMTAGFDVFVQLVMAAITTWLWSTSQAVPSAEHDRGRIGDEWSQCRRRRWFGARPLDVRGRAAGGGRIAGRERLGRRRVEPAVDQSTAATGRRAPRRMRHRETAARCTRLASRRATRSCGPGGAGNAGLDRGEVELDPCRRTTGSAAGLVPQTLRLGVRLDQGDPLLGTTGEAQVPQGLVVDREDRDRRPVLGRHVADRGPVLERHAGHTGPVELDELADDAVAAELLGDGEHEVGGGRPVRQFAVQPEARPRGGSSMLMGWPSMAASASMPPTPHPNTPSPFTIGVWESVPTNVSG